MTKVKNKKISKKLEDTVELILPNDHYHLKRFIFFMLLIIIIIGLGYFYKVNYYDNAEYQFNKHFNSIYQSLLKEYHNNYHNEDKIDYLLTINDNSDNPIKKYINKTTFQGSLVIKDKQYINNLTTKYNDDINTYQILSNYENKVLKNQISIINEEYTFNYNKSINLDYFSLLKLDLNNIKLLGKYSLNRKDGINTYTLLITKDELKRMFNNTKLNNFIDSDLEIVIETKGLLEKIDNLVLKTKVKEIKLDLNNNIYNYSDDKLILELDKKDLLKWRIKINYEDKLIKGDLLINKSDKQDYEIKDAYHNKDINNPNLKEVVSYLQSKSFKEN